MHPFVGLMRRYCIDYTNSHDQSLYDELMEPDYVVHINGMDLGRSTTYARSVEKLFAMAPADLQRRYEKGEAFKQLLAQRTKDSVRGTADDMAAAAGSGG